MATLGLSIIIIILVLLFIGDKLLDIIGGEFAPLEIGVLHDSTVTGDRGFKRFDFELFKGPFHNLNRTFPGGIKSDQLGDQ